MVRKHLEIDDLLKNFSDLHPISTSAWQAFSKMLKIRRISAQERYIDLGDSCDRLGFVLSGLLKAYYVTPAGNEFIHAFIAESEPCVAYAGALTGKPSSAIFETIEESTIAELPVNSFRSLFQDFSDWNHIGRILVEKQYVAKVRRIGELLTDSYETRLELFINSNPHLAGRLKQVHIAAYLGIRPETLSRLRAKVPGVF